MDTRGKGNLDFFCGDMTGIPARIDYEDARPLTRVAAAFFDTQLPRTEAA